MMEVEFIATSQACREAILLRNLQMQMKSFLTNSTEEPPLPIGCDNQGVLNFIKTGITKKQTKHIHRQKALRLARLSMLDGSTKPLQGWQSW
jgi:hypothetical protein